MKTLFAFVFAAGIAATAVVGCAHKQEAGPTTPSTAPSTDAGGAAAAPESAPPAPAEPANRPPPN